MLFLSDRMTSASGSIGGTTFSHNRYGLYTRSRRKPVNPNTASQQAQRAAFSAASAAWRAQTGSHRTGWDAYASSSPTTNALGSTVFVPGQTQFVASNSLRLRFGLALVTTPPVTSGRLAIGDLDVVIDVSDVNATISGLVAGAVGAEVGLFLGDPVSSGVSFFAGPYQLVGNDTVAASTLELDLTGGRNGLPFVAGQIVPWRVAGVNTDGRLTTVASGFTTVVA